MSGPESWTFHHPVAIHYGVDCWRGAGERGAGRNWLLLTTAGMVRRGTAERIRAGWGGAGRLTVCGRAEANPEVGAVESVAGDLRVEGFDGIVALGGGSTIDTAKALAVLLPGGGELREILRGAVPVVAERVLPVWAVPTTAGAGSEATPFATVWDGEARRKLSLHSPAIFPRMALLDPELTADLPREVGVATGLDALAQALESIWNGRANPMTTALATRSAALVLGALPGWAAGRTPAAAQRGDLLWGSTLAGMAISHTRTALAHSMSYPLTAHFGVPHGLACGFTLPAILDFNVAADDGRLARLATAIGCGDLAGLRARLVGLLGALGVDELLSGRGLALLCHVPLKKAPQKSVTQWVTLPMRIQAPTDLRLNTVMLDGEKMERVAAEMILPGRADNNLRPATLDDARGILRATGEYLPSCRFP